MTWLFAYAELMGEHLLRSHDVQPALLSGYHRSFVHSSTLLWGTPEHPCPLVGLAPGGECWGLGFQVSWTARRPMVRRLQPTEHSGEYRRVRLPTTFKGGGEEQALVWVSKPELAGSSRWADQDGLAEALLAAHGTAGRGVEYVRTIYHALELWGLRDPMIESVWSRLAAWRPR